MAKMGYDGWGNYETWLVSTWIHCDSLEIEHWTEEARICGNGAYGLAQRLKDHYQNECNSQVKLNGLFSDLVQHALDGVDWYKIARSLLGYPKEGIMTHTPGPWTYRKANIHYHIEAPVPSYGKSIACVSHVENASTGWTSEANARLIAAAPAMLDQLKDIAHELGILVEWKILDPKLHCIITATLPSILKTIEKAEKGTS